MHQREKIASMLTLDVCALILTSLRGHTCKLKRVINQGWQSRGGGAGGL